MGVVEAEDSVENENWLHRPVLGPTRQTLQLKEFRAFAVLQTRLQLLLTDELIARLRVIFENEFLFRFGVHWGDNQLCGAVYSAIHRRSLVECKFPEASKALLLQGKVRSLSITDLFILVLQVSTNRYRRVDGQPASVTCFGGQKPAPPSKLFRIAGTVDKNNTFDVSATRKIHLLSLSHRPTDSDLDSRCAGPSRSCAPYATSISTGSECTTPPLSQTAGTSRPSSPQAQQHRLSARCNRAPRPCRRGHAPRRRPARPFWTRRPDPAPGPALERPSPQAGERPPSSPGAQ
jgi:hypothetical protein